MLRMDQVHVIRHKVLVEGQSIRSVARQMGVSRNTVRKYLKEPEPVRKAEESHRARPVMDKVAPLIEELLEDWEDRTTEKQRITGTLVHRKLVEDEIEVSVTTVRDYLREKRRQKEEVFIPLVYRPGEDAQVDFFEVTVEVGGQRKKAWKFVMRLMYSGRDFAWIYEHCDQLTFLDGHVRAFEAFGSVPRKIVYDNLSAAVKKVMFPDRELTDRFRALVSTYLFEPCFTRVGVGHDKGGVVSRGKGIRLQHLTPIPRGESLWAISEQLHEDLRKEAEHKRRQDGRTVATCFDEERAHMRPLPEVPFDPRRAEIVSVSRKALVRIEGAEYSVPSHWNRLQATALVGVYQIQLICRGEEITLERQPRKSRTVCYRHYHRELARKPAAVRQVAPKLLAELGEPYGHLYRLLEEAHGAPGAARVLAKILGAMGEHGEKVVTEALASALELDRIDLLGLSVTSDNYIST
jgi:transposase